MRQLLLARWGLLLFIMLGLTSGIGAIQHGNDPTMSFMLSLVSTLLFLRGV